MSEQQNAEPTDMNARLRLRRTTSPADMVERLFGAPEAEPTDDDTDTGGDEA